MAGKTACSSICWMKQYEILTEWAGWQKRQCGKLNCRAGYKLSANDKGD